MFGRRVAVAACPLAARSFAAEVQIPVRLFGLGGRYATALFGAASSEKGGLEAVEQDLGRFKQLLESSTILNQFINDPTVSRVKKTTGIKEFLQDEKYAETTKKFLAVIAENGRMNSIGKIMDSYLVIMQAHRKEVTAEVTTAEPLKPKQLDEVKAALGHYIQPNEKILLTTKIDPKIIGGLVISIGDRFIDMSIKSRINALSRLLEEPLQ